MQIYFQGTNPLYWKQIEELPQGVYNRDTNQTTSALVNQLFTAFIGRDVGTTVAIYMSVNNGNPTRMATAKVVDETGFVYARFKIPHTQQLPQLDFHIKEFGPFFDFRDKTIASESFSSGNIAYMFEVQAKALEQPLIDSVQIEQNASIDGVEDSLLEPKFGTFTGLTRRSDQLMDTYRGQTSCLWNASQYAGTEKGVEMAVQCILGDFDGTQLNIVIVSSKSLIPNLIFTNDQFGPSGFFPPVAGYMPDHSPTTGYADWERRDNDKPHYYVPDLGPTGDGYFTDGDTLPTLETLGDFPGVLDGSTFDYDTAQVLTIPSTNAIGSEVTVSLASAATLGIPEEVALANVASEQVLRRNPASGGLAYGATNPDYVANPYVAIAIRVTSCIIGGLEKILDSELPKEDVDFTVNRLLGKIIWNNTAKIPDEGTAYTVSYKFRLDTQLRVAIRKVKPAFKKVLIVFSQISSGLPKSLEA